MCWVAALVLAGPGSASAHKGKAERSLNLEVADGQLVALVHLRVTGDDKRRALFVLADHDHNGRLDAHEQTGLQTQLVTRALFGIRLLVESSTVTLEGVQARLQASADGPIEVMVHGTTRFSPEDDTVRITTIAGAERLAVRAVPGKRRLISASRGRPSRRGIYEAEMGSKDALSLVFGPASP